MNITNWKTFYLNDLFDVVSGNGFDANKMTSDSAERVAFVTRSAKNNGVVKFVDVIQGEEPFEAGNLTVALGGSLGSTFLQVTPFYTGEHQVVLIPKIDMTNEQKLFIATIIQYEAQTNYTPFGRELDRYIRKNFKLMLPVDNSNNLDLDFMNSYIRNLSIIKKYTSDTVSTINDVEKAIAASIHNTNKYELKKNTWKEFTIGELFDVDKGKMINLYDVERGSIPYITSSENNNGVAEFIDEIPCFEGNLITVNSNGSIGEAFYQAKPFVASGNVSVLRPKNWVLNEEIGMFLCTIIKFEKYRFSYGRTWNSRRLTSSKIFLPVTDEGNPDWNFMESYIKSMKH